MRCPPCTWRKADTLRVSSSGPLKRGPVFSWQPVGRPRLKHATAINKRCAIRATVVKPASVSNNHSGPSQPRMQCGRTCRNGVRLAACTTTKRGRLMDQEEPVLATGQDNKQVMGWTFTTPSSRFLLSSSCCLSSMPWSTPMPPTPSWDWPRTGRSSTGHGGSPGHRSSACSLPGCPVGVRYANS